MSSASDPSPVAEPLSDSSPRISETCEEEDSWVSAARQNKAQSLLFSRLPEELLLKIMTSLTLSGLYLLRHTSRVFMRLFEDPCFDTVRDRPRLEHERDVWSHVDVDLLQRLNRAEYRHLGKRIARDIYCRPCFGFLNKEGDAAVQRARRQPWGCGACDADHGKALFSPAQRHIPRRHRRCIGREGHVRVCRHMTLSWADVELWGRMDDQLREQAEHIVCQHASHNPLLAAAAAVAIDGGAAASPGRLTFPLTLSPEEAKAMAPTVDFERGSSKLEAFPACIYVRWSALVFEIAEDERVTFARLREGMRKLAAETTNSLCPHMTFDDGQLLLAFDPNRCACLGLTVPVRHYHHDYGTPETQPEQLQRTCCLCNTGAAAAAAGSPRAAGRFLPADGAQHHVSCRYCDAWYEWTRVGRYVVLRAHVDIEARAPTARQWLQHVPPETYGLIGDRLARNITWCKDPRCATTFRWRQQGNEVGDKGKIPWHEEEEFLARLFRESMMPDLFMDPFSLI
ncbi:hypothetical protein NKR23_g1965 [Pleurostoma richardsiae]|uniref:F-box domain-containing protein n=1 Tax=Pleurostoma richardsiae TaxID=41990 RepID=A0AA38VW84_9PEZI|nr:hypothetical protein NKR23_g1965 [Pleurostoma richardsiae]